MSDIDLLVREIDLARVETKLLHLGYRLDASTKEYRRKHDYHFVFTKSGDIKIEIHWGLQRPVAPFRIDIDGLWERAQPTTLAGVEALALSPEDLLLHLCQHIHKHKLIGGIRPLCDVAHVVEYYNNTIDWTEVRTRSCQWRVAPYIYLVLSLAKELLDARIPSSFLNTYEPAGFDRALLDDAKTRFLEFPEPSPISSNLVQLCWEGHRFKERVTALRAALAAKVVAQSYGLPQDSNWLPLYYPRRIRYLLTRYGRLVWQFAKGDQSMGLAMKRQERQVRLTKWLSSGYQ